MLFFKTSLLDKNTYLQKEAGIFIETFSDLLLSTINIAYGVIGLKNDMVTPYTLSAEKMSEFLTGVPIDRTITKLELKLTCSHDHSQCNPALVKNICELNCKSIEATKAIATYPLLIYHIRREAEFFIDILVKLQRREDVDIIEDALNQEAFWNRIMAEHSKFIRGLLDPTEEDLFETSNDFANEFDELRRKALASAEKTGMVEEVTDESLEATKRIKDFKEQAAKGLLQCEIRSIAIPLLADHVLREANHYLMLLKKYDIEI